MSCFSLQIKTLNQVKNFMEITEIIKIDTFFLIVELIYKNVHKLLLLYLLMK